MSGGCLEVQWRLSVKGLEGVCEASGGYQEGDWKVSGGYLEGAWWVSGGYLEGVQKNSTKIFLT